MTMQATAFCGSCGAPDETQGRFCGSCGKPLAAAGGTVTPGIPAQPTGEALPATIEDAASTETVVVDNAFAWTLAVTPLLLILVDGALAAAGVAAGVTVGILIAVAVNTVLSIADSRRLKAAGVNVPGLLAVFLVPVYLFVRQSRAKQAAWIPIVWCICFVASLAGGQIVARTIGVPIDASAVEHSISTGVQAQSGVPVTVSCPSAVVRVGSSFSCVVSTGTAGSLTATVTVQNASGSILWRLDNASSDTQPTSSNTPATSGADFQSAAESSLKEASIAEESFATDNNGSYTMSLDALASQGLKAEDGVGIAVLNTNNEGYCLAAGPVGGQASYWLSSTDNVVTTTPCG